jgi:hypothetical protein
VQTANNAFCQEFQLSKEQIQGKQIFELSHNHWQLPGLREALNKVLPHNKSFQNLVVEQSFEDGTRRMRLNGRRLEGVDGELIFVAFEELC